MPNNAPHNALRAAVNRAIANDSPVFVNQPPALPRVQVPAYSDSWMQGDRYGNLVKVTTTRDGTEIAHVMLDKSGKQRMFRYEDCTAI